MDKKTPKLEKMLDQDINIPMVNALRYEFANKEGYLNAKGRLYVKAALFIFTLIYIPFAGDFTKAAFVYFLASIIYPTLFDITTIIAVKKMKLKNGNLYDMLAAFGCYAIMSIAFAVVYIFIFIKKYVETHPEIFENPANDGIPTVAGTITAIGIMLLIYDFVMYMIEKREPKKKAEDKGEKDDHEEDSAAV